MSHFFNIYLHETAWSEIWGRLSSKLGSFWSKSKGLIFIANKKPLYLEKICKEINRNFCMDWRNMNFTCEFNNEKIINWKKARMAILPPTNQSILLHKQYIVVNPFETELWMNMIESLLQCIIFHMCLDCKSQNSKEFGWGILGCAVSTDSDGVKFQKV